MDSAVWIPLYGFRTDTEHSGIARRQMIATAVTYRSQHSLAKAEIIFSGMWLQNQKGKERIKLVGLKLQKRVSPYLHKS